MSTVAVRVDDKLKNEATELFQSLGLDMSTAVKMFLIQSVNTKSIPFEIKGKSDDEELEDLIFSKMEGVRVDSNHPENVVDFFDEDFPEYREK